MTKLLYQLSRLALLLLTVAFASFSLVTIEGMSFLEPVVENATKYLPILLVPVTIAMAILLFLRYLGKESDESLGFNDFFAGLLAIALQVVVLVVWRAQGNEIAGELMTNVPDVPFLQENAGTIGVMGVAAIQFVAFVLYCIADPDPRRDRDDD